jgi:hypothetical protein
VTTEKTPSDQRKANLLKAVRNAVRLHYSIMADNKLNVLLPKIEERFDNRDMSKPFVLSTSDIIRELEAEGLS